eukprot:5351302-Ditylum_brightwellii.AAC.1
MDILLQSHESNHFLAEKLDKLLIQVCTVAVRKCKCRQSEWWSLPLIQARSKVHILNSHLTKLRCKAQTSSTVTKFGITVMCPSTISDTIQSLKSAKLQVVEVLKQSKEKWREHNKKVAEIHALSGSVTADQALKAIINAEDMAQKQETFALQKKEG